MSSDRSDHHSLKQNEVGLWVGIATASGLIVGQLTFVTAGFGFGSMGPMFLLAMLTGLLVAYIQVLSFSELSNMFPRAGSVFDYVEKGLGPVFGMMAAFAGYIMIAIFSGGAELAVAGILVEDQLLPGTTWWLWAAGIGLVLALINIVGIRWYGAVDVAVTAVLVLMMVAVGGLGLAGVGVGEPVTDWAGSTWPGVSGFSSFVALAFFLYIGFEYVCPLAEEMRNARRNIPLSMAIGLAMVFVAHSLFGLAATRWVPLENLAGSATPHVLFAGTIFGSAGRWVIGIMGLAASISSINALYVAAPRILYGMSKDGYLPEVFAWVHPKFRTPAFSIAFIALLSVLPLVMGAESTTVLLLILGSVFAWIVSYALIHASLISLRVRQPERSRPFRSPLFPLPQIVGIVALLYMITNLSPDPAMTGDIYVLGGVLLAIGAIYSIAWQALRMKQVRVAPSKEDAPEDTASRDAQRPSGKV